jgi:hypothetical protein
VCCLLATACHEEALNTDTDTGLNAHYGAAIAFTEHEMPAVTPLSMGDRNADNLTAMTVYAHHTGGVDFADAAGSAPNFMFAQEVGKNDNGVWSYSPVKYWPAQEGRVSFFAIAPALDPETDNGIELITTAGASYTGYPAFKVTPPAAASAQQDICVAATMNRTRTAGTVPFTFAHAMAKVTFSAQYAATDNITLKTLKLANVITGGTLTLTADAPGFTWSVPAAKGTYTLSGTDLVSTNLPHTGLTKGNVTTVAGTLMLVPQDINGAKVELTLQTGNSDITETFTVPAETPVLVAGKSYDYNLTNVDPWFNRPQWAATATVLEGTSASATQMFDNDLNSNWHSSTTTLPQVVTVDMQGNKLIEGFYLFHERTGTDPNNRAFPTSITIETSLTGKDGSWKIEYTNTSLNQKKARIALPLASPVVARYFRLTV